MRNMVCAYDEMHRAMRRAGVDPRSVALNPYFDSGNPSAPLRLSYLQFVVGPPDCSDWSENIGRIRKHALDQHGLRDATQSCRFSRR
jgi:type IV pilus biogenesis protein CpaD/CtpE